MYVCVANFFGIFTKRNRKIHKRALRDLKISLTPFMTFRDPVECTNFFLLHARMRENILKHPLKMEKKPKFEGPKKAVWRIHNVLMRIRISLSMQMRIRIQMFQLEREKNFFKNYFVQNLAKLVMGNFLSKNDLIDKKTQI